MPRIPAALAKVRNEALRYVEAERQHHLNLGRRRALWNALGPHENRAPIDRKNPGYRRRATLAILCAERVLPFWEAFWPTVWQRRAEVELRPQHQSAPRNVLERARRRLDGKRINPRSLREDAARLTSLSETLNVELGLGVDGDMDSAIWVGSAVRAAVRAVVADERFRADQINLELRDRDIDADQLDAAFFGEFIYADCASRPASKPERRRSFWRWYLKEAVPTAWRAT